MTDADFEALGPSSCQYLVRYHGDSQAFRRAIYDRYIMAPYSAAQDNPRISMVDMQAKMFIIMAYILLCTLPLIAVGPDRRCSQPQGKEWSRKSLAPSRHWAGKRGSSCGIMQALPRFRAFWAAY